LSCDDSGDEGLDADAALQALCHALRCVFVDATQRAARDSLTRCNARHGAQFAGGDALAALEALSADAVTDSAAWPAVCPALRSALAAPPPSDARALAVLRRLVRSAHASRAATQLAQLATCLAAHLQSPAADAAGAAGALLEAEAALRSCWQARGAAEATTTPD